MNSSGAIWAPMTTVDHTVQAASGSAAASSKPTPSGTGMTWRAGADTYSA